MIAFGQNSQRPVRRILQDPHEGQRSSDLCYSSSGFSLHAATVIPFWDRKRLFNLCCYISRPPLSKHSLEELPNGDLKFKLKTPWSDGTTHLVFTPVELIEKLAALVPPPRFNQLRYHGILAPNAKYRSKVVPIKKKNDEETTVNGKSKKKRKNRSQIKFAELMKKTLNIDIEVCPKC